MGFTKIRAMLVLSAAIAALAACNQSLGVKETIVDKIEDEKTYNSPAWHGTRAIAQGTAYSAKVGFSGDDVYVLYDDFTARSLKIVKSSDRGLSWDDPYTIATASSTGTDDVFGYSNGIAVDNQNIYISYCLNENSPQVYFVHLLDTGSGFTSSGAENISAKTTADGKQGYDNAIAFDSVNIYIVYSGWGYAPMFSYRAKTGASFATPLQIDSNIALGGTRSSRGISMSIEGGGVRATYFDDSTASSLLKCASFSTSSSFPLGYTSSGDGWRTTQNITVGSSIGNVVDPIAATESLISFYDPTSMDYKLYEYYLYSVDSDPPSPYGPALVQVCDLVTIDDSSSDIGRASKLLMNGETLYSAYVDVANNQVKFAIGTKASVSTDYAFSNQVIDTAGGAHYCCDVVHDSVNSTFYVVYYDSTDGALKMAKSTDDGLTW